ncbi:TetR/AcrR family transcriptional regulator [Phycicoccus flavus]|uniref:TetR/AcrR family transcriptional regulator n=1 Tax=Phycicoccus flavus TaxID=2502783 RepID=UPI000FEB9486|nr:TetR/AcrR family transcriptional regulator [Phycicoccus flavus]NHA68251.1 helix-turn-helix transcriptional regulator [Phycicoccus flavus]
MTRAAADLADRSGPAAMTMAAVARELGVRAPSLYAHVAGEQDLRERVALTALAEIAEELGAALAGRAGRDAVQALAETLRAYAIAHPGRYAASRTRLDTRTAADSAGPRQSDLLRAVLRGYDITDPAEAVHAIRVMSGLVHGVVDLEAAGSFDHSDPPPEESWVRVVDTLDAILRAWPPGSTRPSG